MAPYTRSAAPYTSVAMLSSAQVCGTRMTAGCQDPIHNDIPQQSTNTIVCFTRFEACLLGSWHGLALEMPGGSRVQMHLHLHEAHAARAAELARVHGTTERLGGPAVDGA